MTTIEKDGYIFAVDLEKTREYYGRNTLCQCCNCRNYYAQAWEKFPKLEAFLEEFGVDIQRPDELGSIDLENRIDYLSADFTVCGRVEKWAGYEFDIPDECPVSVSVHDGYVSPNEQTGEYFTFCVWNINLPWVLDEPFPVPPVVDAGEKKKGFFQRLFRK